jgi:phosphoglycerol transferase MdoB-like AlkP superfamily enzyme
MIKKIGSWFNGLSWRGNIYVALVLSLLLLMALYSISRVGFYLFNTDFFPGMDANRFMRILWGGLRFDLSAVLYSNSLFILLLILPTALRFKKWYQQIVKWTFIIVNSIALAANTADIIYYRFTLRRTTMSVFAQFEHEKNKGLLFMQFLWDYWYVVLFWLILVVLLVQVYKRIRMEGPQIKNTWIFHLSALAMVPVVVYLFIGGARGGFLHSTRPITLSNAAAYARDPKDINLVLNTPFAFMRTAKANVIKKVYYFHSDEELNAVFNPLKMPSDSSRFDSLNVVVIIIESYSKEFVGAYNQWMEPSRYRGYTPFLDSLISVSRAYQHSLANGRKSIDAMPSVLASIPSIEVPYVLSHYSGNKINSLAGLLKKKGYYSAFFHGAPNGSMGFDAFANLCGYDDYFGKDEYNNDADYDGIWGIWDDKFLQYFAAKMNTFRQPFHTAVFTTSSHHPYKIPKAFEGQFRGGDRDIYKTIEYSDYALKKFFQSASRMPWYKNTLFVITADHASAEIAYPEYNTAWGYFSVPVFFFRPGSDWKEFKPEIVQQIDIMPTVLGYLHYDEPYIAFGRDAFRSDKRPFAFNYLNQLYQYFQGDYLLQFDGSRSVALYDFKNDKLLQKNLREQLPDTVRVMEQSLKGLIQHYNNRMVDDNLTVEGSPIRNSVNGSN